MAPKVSNRKVIYISGLGSLKVPVDITVEEQPELEGEVKKSWAKHMKCCKDCQENELNEAQLTR